MTDERTYSIQTMKACTGNAPGDVAYMQWFIQESESRLLKPATELRNMVDGSVEFTSRTYAEANARLADVRRHATLLRECQDWFAGKSPISKKFAQKLAELQEVIDAAESAYVTLHAWFDGPK